MNKRVLILCMLSVLMLLNYVYALDTAKDSVIESVEQEVGLKGLVDSLKEFTNDSLDIAEMSNKIVTGKGIDYGVIGNLIINKGLFEIHIGLKTGISILIVIVLSSIIKSLELEKDSSITQVASFVEVLVIVIILIKAYVSILTVFTETIDSMTRIIQLVSPFMLAILIATGEAVTSGIVGPIILFVTSLVGIIVTYCILPLLTVGIVFKILTNISPLIKLEKLGKMCTNNAMVVISIVFTLFLGILSLETSITTSIDAVTVKTGQAAVSNLVPVVGKFVSDSLEVVMGASQIIGRASGVIGIIVILIVVVPPILKLLAFLGIYSLLEGISETLGVDEKVTKIIGAFKEQYKTMVGIMIGVAAIFIIAVATVISLMGRVAS